MNNTSKLSARHGHDHQTTVKDFPDGAVPAAHGDLPREETTGARAVAKEETATDQAARAARSPLVREKVTKRARRARPIPHEGGKKKTARESAPKRPLRPTATGWLGRGGGQAVSIQPADEFRATTVQVCGLYPFSVGTGTPMIGVPLGKNLATGASVCCDPISWFQRANLISNPSMFVLGKPGLGKSSLTRRMAAGLAGYGTLPLVLGDLKPDYVDLIRALGGQVITLGRGRGYLNILDPGEAHHAAARLTAESATSRRLADAAVQDAVGETRPEEIARLLDDGTAHTLRAVKLERLANQVLADAHGRRHTMIAALLTILRSEPPSDREETIIDRALKHLDESHDGIPVLADLLRVIQEAPNEIRQVALDRGDLTRYKAITENLEASLIGLTTGGRLGEVFSQQTTTPMRRDRPVVYDVSSIDDSEGDLQAAILLACWSAGFGTVNVAAALADAELEPRRHYFVILDELWRALRAGRGMVDRVDALTRLNRARGVGLAMISHTMSDLLSLASTEDQMKAKGFVERSGMVVCGGLPGAEMPLLTSAVPLSMSEQSMLTSWQDPPAWDPVSGHEAEPPGRGRFLIKVGGRPGIPIRVELTMAEMEVNDTNKLWHTASRAGRAADPVNVEILP
ncbi:ATP/GTP-binding protein [Subtercola boreus]|uniref:ATP/GTP-binding protein n=1 Tax=Subtercola boreus TaxID=120213 RepID=UPI00209C4DAA|nr:ATP/GTP-binding protein [Subtercola boreus]